MGTEGCLADSVIKHLTLAQIIIPQFVSSSPTLGEFRAPPLVSTSPASLSLSVTLSLSLSMFFSHLLMHPPRDSREREVKGRQVARLCQALRNQHSARLEGT